ncbi:hypothetical protein [Saccharothrix luteola]|uniref:hypothetical protein n=1 Tax=Saccharothrix luteola TaxID=2893018 RepID=UPI001E2A3638|nr:hypothetical protein [Saccharothrix luteola]MCC8250700.1 hypothetical protein [Saccharothrix luteola]
MSDEVRDMIRSALADEPALGLAFERVVEDGRKRRARRRFGALTTAVVGVVAVVAVAVSGTFTQTSAPVAGVLSTTPTTSVTSSAASTPGCAVEPMTGGFPDLPRGGATPAELAESGRLTEAFGQFALPLPAGVEATPLRLCAIADSWGGHIELTGDRKVIVYVRPLGGQPPGECALSTPSTSEVRCAVEQLPDGSTAKVDVLSTAEVVLATVEVWRNDGTYVSVSEVGGRGSRTRVLDDDRLTAIATAPQLKVQWVGRPVPPAPSDRRAAELGPVLAGALPPGVTPERTSAGEALEFRISQGAYRAIANLTDSAGSGWVMVNLEKPGGGEVGCGSRATCRLVDLPDGRKAALDTLVDGGVTRLSLRSKAADGTWVDVQTSNVADTGGGSGAPTRPTPPLAEADLVRIVELPDLHW